MVTICDHTIDETLLSRDSAVLDLGCRNFQFSKGILEYVDKVYSVDPDTDINPPLDYPIKFINGAVGAFDVVAVEYVKYGNGTGNFINVGRDLPQEHKIEMVPMLSLQTLGIMTKVPFWDLIKMDIEGMEYEILKGIEWPIAKQISVEFHEHTSLSVGKEQVEKLLVHLQKWYELAHVDYSDKHGCGFNYWDVLLIQK